METDLSVNMVQTLKRGLFKISVLGYIASLLGSMKRNRLGVPAGYRRLHEWILIASYVAGWF